MKKITAYIAVLALLAGLLGVVPSTVTAETAKEVYASQYYHVDTWITFGSFWSTFSGKGSVNQGQLEPSTISAERLNSSIVYGSYEDMVFTFDQPTTISSMTFQSIDDGQFPAEYWIRYRDPAYYSEVHGFTGNPDAETIDGWYDASVEIEGFGPDVSPDEGLSYTEASREGDTVTIQLDEPVTCVALMISTIHITPWSCEEAHFYSEAVEPEPEYPEVFSSEYYHVGIYGYSLDVPCLSFFGRGAMEQGGLDSPTITDPEYDESGIRGNYMKTNIMVFTFDQPTTVSSMTFQSIEDGQFPTDYRIQYRDEAYHSTAYGFIGNPDDDTIEAGENWPVIDGLSPVEGLSYTEIYRKGDTVTIELDEPVTCVALAIEATTDGTTPWSCEEAHFYGSYDRLLGDVNNDGAVNAQDAVRILLHSVGKRYLTYDTDYAEVNGDGMVNAKDAVCILLHTVGKKLIEE